MTMIDARVPLWFYEVTSVIYLVSAIICFVVSFFSYKTYKMDKKKKILLLLFGFLLLGIGFIVLAVPSLYIYFGLTYYQQTSLSINYVNYLGFSIYYVVSSVAYLLFLGMYIPKKFSKKNFIIFVPLWYANSVRFNLFSIFVLLIIFLKTLINSIRKRNLNSFLVMFSFLSLALFHLLTYLTSFSVTSFVLAHSILILGFISLLSMLIRVNYIGKKKV
jgi:hypothetical protein